MSERKIKFGVDYDGVIVKNAPGWHFAKRASKMGLEYRIGVNEGLLFLKSEPDVELLGIYTARPKWLRETQTANQIERLNIPVDAITHTPYSSKAKIETLLLDAAGLNPDSEIICPHNIGQIVLIDDNEAKVTEAARDLAEEKPHLLPLLKKFTFVVFDPKQPEKMRGTIIPGIIHIVKMKCWHDARKMLESIRQRTS